MVASELYEVCSYSNNHEENTETHCEIGSDSCEVNSDPKERSTQIFVF